MVATPETRYAWNGDVCLAYQVVGDGQTDLLYLQGYSSQVDLNWESRYLSRFLRGLAERGRLIVTDRRGWGCSDRFSVTDVAALDALTDDLLAVLRAAGSGRAAVLATAECSLVALLFAASHPSETSALILIDPFPATYAKTDGTPWQPSVEDWEEAAVEIAATWGTPAWLTPALLESWKDERELDWYLRYQRASITPSGLAAEIRRYVGTDVRPVLPSIQAPTLLFGASEGSFDSPIEGVRFLAERIPGAKLIEQSAAGSLHGLHWYSRADAIVAEIGRFLSGIAAEQVMFDRFLTTVVFTDIVDSTVKAVELGDRAWHDLLERHHATVRTMLARYRGVEVDTAGDGFFATFDGPARAVRCATAIAEAVRTLGLEIRAGVHTGEVELAGDSVLGLAVHIGARVAAVAHSGEVLVSSTVRDLVAGSGLVFEDAGEHDLKGVPDRWHLYRVVT